MLKAMLAIGIGTLGMFALAGGEAGSGSTPPEQEAEAYASEAGRVRNLLDAYGESEIVFEGTVLKVGKPPGVWCGVAVTWQEVTFRVEKVWKGELGAKEATVAYWAVCLGIFRPGAELNPVLFKPGNRCMVFVTSEGGPDKLLGIPGEQDKGYLVWMR